MNKDIVEKVTKNYLPILSHIRKDAMAALLDEQTPYELFEEVACGDPCICINLYRSIGEKRPDKETEHITLSTLANIYGINALRNKLTKFSELYKTSLTDHDKDYCMHILVRCMHLSKQVLALSNLIGDQYPKQMSMAALLFSSGELHYAASKLEDKKYNLSLKERINLNHDVAMKFNLPLMVKQSTGSSFSGSYQSEIIYWSYRYLIATEECDQELKLKSIEEISKILCINSHHTHKHLTQIALDLARDSSQYALYMAARYMLYQHYDNKIEQGSESIVKTAEASSQIDNPANNEVSNQTNNQEDEQEKPEEWPAQSFINWLVDFRKNTLTENKQDAVRLICGEIDKVKPADMFLFIRYCKETRCSKVVWSSSKHQINLQEILQPVETKDALTDVVARKDKIINITSESLAEKNLNTLFQDSFLNRLGAKQLVLGSIYEDYFEASGGHFVYLFCVANLRTELNKKQINIIRMIRHFFRNNYLATLQSDSISHNVVQIAQN